MFYNHLKLCKNEFYNILNYKIHYTKYNIPQPDYPARL